MMRSSVKVSIFIFTCLALSQLYINIVNVSRALGFEHLSASSPLLVARQGTSSKGDISTAAVSSHLKDVYMRERELEGLNSSVIQMMRNAVRDQVSRHFGWLGLWTEEMDTSQVDLRAKLPVCNSTPPGLVGVHASNQTAQNPADLERKFSFLKLGGNYHPPECRQVQRTAIIIPYRNRWSHLHILLNNLIPFLVRQQASFTLFVIEQAPPTTFNRALLLNIGVLETLKRDNYTCFIFHDVDLVPLDDHNLYRCGDNPRHLAVGISKFHYRLPYLGYFGGVSAVSRGQVEKINGNSNLFFGWGGEDDDLYARVTAKGMKVVRYPAKIGRYDMIKHERDKGNEANPLRSKLLQTTRGRMEKDGLSTTKYHVTSLLLKPLYTWITVSVNESGILSNAPESERKLFADILNPKPAVKVVPLQAQSSPLMHVGALQNSGKHNS